MHVQIIFASDPIAIAMTPATNQQIVPIETRVTTDAIVERDSDVMEEE